MYRIESVSGVLAACRACGGFWLDSAACRALLQSALGDDATAFAKSFGGAEPLEAPSTDGYRSRAQVPRCCPVCQESLVETETREPVLRVDVCREHGTFFDAREIAGVISAAEARSWERQWHAENLRRMQEEGQQDAEANRIAMQLFLGVNERWSAQRRRNSGW